MIQTETLAVAASETGKPIRFNSRKVSSDGYTFDSAAEERRYFELKYLQMAGEISDLRIHPRYELIPRHIYQGIKIREIDYEADFSYTERSRQVVEDVKGFGWNKRKKPPAWEPRLTEGAQLKIKMFKYRYPDIDFRIIES
jgi:hypothetical protein